MAIFIYGKSQLHNNLPKLFLMFVWPSCICERISVVGLEEQWERGSSFKMLLLGGVLTLWLWSPQMLHHSFASHHGVRTFVQNCSGSMWSKNPVYSGEISSRAVVQEAARSAQNPTLNFCTSHHPCLLVPGGGSAGVGGAGVFMLDKYSLCAGHSTCDLI